jgi:hypothetical protein
MYRDGEDYRKSENIELRAHIDKLLSDGDAFLKECFPDLNISHYEYDISLAVEALGLEEELVFQLVEDYIIQILKSKIHFENYIQELEKAKENNEVMDYEKLRHLAHKNLGVARNLRIEDAQKLLTILLKDDDLEYLKLSLKALEVSAVKLIPLFAYETLNLIQVKNSL